MTIDDLGLRPSRLQLADPARDDTAGRSRSADACPGARDAGEGCRACTRAYASEMPRCGGISIETPQGPLKLSAMRFNLENGKVSEFAIEGLDGRTPARTRQARTLCAQIPRHRQPDANVGAVRKTRRKQPSPDKAIGMIALIEGAELKGLVAPFKNTGKPVNIDTFSLDWGQFVGPIPSKARLTMKMSAPLDASDPGQRCWLRAAWTGRGRPRSRRGLDGNLRRIRAGEPVAFELSGLLKASARVSLANVPREVFSVDPTKAMAAAAHLEAGATNSRLRDTGGIDLLVAQQARTQNVSRDEARRAIVDGIRSGSETSRGS